MVQTFRVLPVATAYMAIVAVANIVVCPSSFSPCVVKSLNGTATTPVEMDSSGDINATKKSIDTVDCQTLQASNFTRMNLSYNALSSMDSLLCLPSSLQVLDVSYNQLTAMENINWNYFPHLTTLILRGNAIASMRNTSFPSTLTTLDLSDNPLASVVLSKATYSQLNALPSLSMRTMTQRVDLLFNNFEFNGCGVQDIKYLGENVVCIATSLPSIESAAASTAGHLVAIVVLFAVVIGGGALYLSTRATRWRRAESSLETCVSASFDGVASPRH